MTNRRGFTLIELLVALVMMAAVAGAIYQLLLNNQRVYQRQTQQVDMQNNLRTVAGFLPADLRELDAGDPLGGDILSMDSSVIRYKATRGLYFLCTAPDTSALTITVFYGDSLRFPRFIAYPNTSRDTLYIYAEGDTATRTDDVWLRSAISSVTYNTNCPQGALPTGAGGYTIGLTNVTAGQLARVQRGAPVRATQIWEVQVYQDARGDWWLGAREYFASGAWSTIQPIAGPLSGAAGVKFAYYDSTGAVTTNPARVRRVRLAVTARSSSRVVTLGGFDYALEELATEVALRNNPGK